MSAVDIEVLPYVSGVVVEAPPTAEAMGVAPDAGACGDGGMVGRAGDAMGGGGGTAVAPAATCAYVIGVERGEPDGGGGVDIGFFVSRFLLKRLLLHASKTRETNRRKYTCTL